MERELDIKERLLLADIKHIQQGEDAVEAEEAVRPLCDLYHGQVVVVAEKRQPHNSVRMKQWNARVWSLMLYLLLLKDFKNRIKCRRGSF